MVERHRDSSPNTQLVGTGFGKLRTEAELCDLKQQREISALGSQNRSEGIKLRDRLCQEVCVVWGDEECSARKSQKAWSWRDSRGNWWARLGSWARAWSPNPHWHLSEPGTEEFGAGQCQGEPLLQPLWQERCSGTISRRKQQREGLGCAGSCCRANAVTVRSSRSSSQECCAGKELIWWEGPCRWELIEWAVHLLSAHLSRAQWLSRDAPITNYENPHAAEHAEPHITSSSSIAQGYFWSSAWLGINHLWQITVCCLHVV